MSVYIIVVLQLATIMAVFMLVAMAMTIAGTSIILWLIGKFVEVCWWSIETFQSTRSRVMKESV